MSVVKNRICILRMKGKLDGLADIRTILPKLMICRKWIVFILIIGFNNQHVCG